MLSWLSVMFPLVFSPGPTNVIVAMSGARYGLRGSLPLLIGINIVYLSYTLLLGLGAGTILDKYPQLLVAIQYAGSAFICYLAYRTWQSERAADDPRTHTAMKLIDGMLLQALNPKFPVILLIMFSTFLESGEALLPQVMTLSVAIVLLNVFTLVCWTLGGKIITRSFQSERSVQLQNNAFAVMLLVLAIWILLR